MGRTRRSITRAGLTAGLTALAVATPSADAYVYWASEQSYPQQLAQVGTGIGRADLDGGNMNPSFVPTTVGRYAQTRGIASDGTHVFFGYERYSPDGRFVAPMVGRVNVDGTDLRQPFSQTTGQAVTGIGVSPTHVYWTNQSQDTSSVGRTPIAGGQQFQAIDSTFGEPNPKPCGVAADDTYMYFANQATWSIGRAELANIGTASQVVDGDWIKLPNGIEPCGVAVDGDAIYFGVWQNKNRPPEEWAGHDVYRADKATGTNRTVLSTEGNEVSGVAVAGDDVYFSSHGRYFDRAGSIKRVRKDGTGGTLTIVGGLTATWGVAADLGGTTPPPPDVPKPVNVDPPRDLLSVGCTGCGSSSAQEPRPADLPRPDFSRVWVTKKAFVAAGWNTPLISVAMNSSHSGAAARSAATGATGSSTSLPLRGAASWSARLGSARVAPSALPTSGPGGTAINYVLTQDATVKLAINRVTKGKRSGKTCKKATAKLRKKKSCDLLKTVATLTRTSATGTNSVPFSGRIDGKALAAGKYRVVLTPSAGAVSAEAKSIDLTIKPKG